jgi:hypothetical protein
LPATRSKPIDAEFVHNGPEELSHIRALEFLKQPCRAPTTRCERVDVPPRVAAVPDAATAGFEDRHNPDD